LCNVPPTTLQTDNTISKRESSPVIVLLCVLIVVTTENLHITEIAEIGTLIVGTGGSITGLIIIAPTGKDEDTQIITHGEIDGCREAERYAFSEDTK